MEQTLPITPTMGSEESHELRLPMPMLEVQAIDFGIPATENDNNAGTDATRPIPIRSATARPSTIRYVNASLPTPGTSPQSPRPALNRNQTSQSLNSSWTNLRETFSSGKASLSGRDNSGATTPNSIFTFSRNSSFLQFRSRKPKVPDSPHLRAMLKSDAAPDLNAVNRALEEVKLIPGEDHGKVVYIESLTRLATELQYVSADCKGLLKQAMLARSQGKPEVCRSLCLRIVQNAYSEAPTKVYAYNILSTQGSPGQSLKYLDESERLIKKYMEECPEFEQLLGVVATLRASALAKEEATRERFKPRELAEMAAGSGDDDVGLEMPVKRRPEGSTSRPKSRPGPDTGLARTLTEITNQYVNERVLGYDDDVGLGRIGT